MNNPESLPSVSDGAKEFLKNKVENSKEKLTEPLTNYPLILSSGETIKAMLVSSDEESTPLQDTLSDELRGSQGEHSTQKMSRMFKEGNSEERKELFNKVLSSLSETHDKGQKLSATAISNLETLLGEMQKTLDLEHTN